MHTTTYSIQEAITLHCLDMSAGGWNTRYQVITLNPGEKLEVETSPEATTCIFKLPNGGEVFESFNTLGMFIAKKLVAQC